MYKSTKDDKRLVAHYQNDDIKIKAVFTEDGELITVIDENK